MAPLAGERLGARYEGRPERLDPDRARRYALATNDHNPVYLDGALPPVFGVVPTWAVFTAAMLDIVPPEARPSLLHAGHDMHFRRPLVAGSVLTSWSELLAVRAARAGTWFTLRVASVGDDGVLVLEQFATLFVRGFDAGFSGGEAVPTHSFPGDSRERPVAEIAASIDADQTLRYRDASGDDNDIHVDPDAARAAGLPGIVVHGLCTMAICSQAVVASAAGDDPTRLTRLAVRFSAPVFPGADLVTSVYDAGSVDGRARFSFEAVSAGRRVIKDGLAEIAN